MEVSEIYCQICATLFPAQFGAWGKSSVVCGNECWDEYKKRSDAVKHKRKPRRLNIAELDPCPSLDPFIQDLGSIPDLIINRYFIPQDTEWLFRGPAGGWPEGHGLEFPIATLLIGKDSKRAYGLANVAKFLQDLNSPEHAATRAFAPTKAMRRPSITELKQWAKVVDD